MPLEMFEGKTGSRLIARLPVVAGSYAAVHTSQTTQPLAVWHMTGLLSNGYPALTPVMSSLPDQVRKVLDQRRRQLRGQYDERLQKIESLEQKFSVADPAGVSQAIALGCGMAILDLERAMLEHCLPAIEKPIICTSIMEGRLLTLRLPKGMFEDMAVTDLGVVESVEIFNAPALLPA